MKTADLQLQDDRRARYEFLAPVLEVQDTPPVRYSRVIALTISAFFVIAVAWAWIGSIDVVAVSQGRTIPAGNVKIIQPLETGVVRAIHVRDGDSVRKGDLLLELDATESAANLDALLIQMDQARIDAAMSLALMGEDPVKNFVPPSEIADDHAVKVARDKIISIHVKHESDLNVIRNEIKTVEASKHSLAIQQEKLEELLPIVEHRVRAQRRLMSSDDMPLASYQQYQQDLIELKADLSIAKQSIVEADASIASHQARIRNLTANLIAQATEQYQEAMRRIALLEQSIRKEQQRLSYLELRAPVSGFVQQLNVHTIGAVVNTAQQLLVIVPEDIPLEIESMILNKDIGFVQTGQEVEIKFETFPFTRYGTITGELVSISNDAIIHEQLGPVYMARVSMDSQQIEIKGTPVDLTPGMTASVEVKTGTRRIIEFFLAPLLRYKDEAIRER